MYAAIAPSSPLVLRPKESAIAIENGSPMEIKRSGDSLLAFASPRSFHHRSRGVGSGRGRSRHDGAPPLWGIHGASQKRQTAYHCSRDARHRQSGREGRFIGLGYRKDPGSSAWLQDVPQCAQTFADPCSQGGQDQKGSQLQPLRPKGAVLLQSQRQKFQRT